MLKHLLLIPTVLLILFSCDSNSLSSDIRGSESLLVLKWESNTNRAKIGIMDIKGNYLKTLFPTFLTGGRIYPYSGQISANRKYLSIHGNNLIADYDPSWIANLDGSIKLTYHDGYGVFWDLEMDRLYMGPNVQYYNMWDRERRVIIIMPSSPWADIPEVHFQSSVQDQSPYYGGEFAVTGRYENWDSTGGIMARANNLFLFNIYNYDKTYVLKEFDFYISSCKFSPTDSLIAFTSWNNNQKDLYLIHMSGSGLQLVIENIYSQSEISWSPDGKKIAYSKEIPSKSPNIFFYDVYSSEETQITFETEPNVGFILNQWLEITD